MKITSRLLFVALFLAALSRTACLAENGMQVYEPLPQAGSTNPVPTGEEEPVAIEVQTNVPQAQFDYRNKRLEARIKREEMLKMRAAVIEASSQDTPAE